ncbi:MAG: hypothetical protein MJZ29_01695 [Bacteroidaceae bacterium]|nr:hypothetical protein [Bacteroidaceae bacterium]
MRKVISFFITGAILFFSACQHRRGTREPVYVDTLSLRDGDLLFREGPSLDSRVVEAVSSGRYSHVGIVHKRNGKWYIIHAVPGESDNGIDSVKMESISMFLQPDRCLGVGVKKIDCTDSVAKAAAEYAETKVGVRFDNSYKTDDSTRYYCTELIWQAYLHQKIDISKGRRHGSNHIYPNDIMP